jgi:hypothetical protein
MAVILDTAYHLTFFKYVILEMVWCKKGKMLLELKGNFPSLHLITEINPFSKTFHVKTLKTMDNVHNKPYGNIPPSKISFLD